MDLKDKLNLLWKYLVLIVFAYGVFSLTCCKNQSASCCSKGSGQVAPCSVNKQLSKQPCGVNCTKPCCASKGAN